MLQFELLHFVPFDLSTQTVMAKWSFLFGAIMARVYVCSKCGRGFWAKAARDGVCFSCYHELHKDDEDVITSQVTHVSTKSETATQDKNNHRSYSYGYVYIMKSAGYYKIGMTSRESGRINELRQLFPVLKLIHQFACNDRSKVESNLHKKYKKQQVTREWYKLKIGRAHV